jgi:hypothetical protein
MQLCNKAQCTNFKGLLPCSAKLGIAEVAKEQFLVDASRTNLQLKLITTKPRVAQQID